MPVPGYATILDNGGSKIEGSVDRTGKEGTVEVIELTHRVHIPTNPKTGKPEGNRVHAPYTITKRFDKTSPRLAEYCATGKQLQKVTVEWYVINKKGKEENYFRHTLENAQVISIQPVVPNTDEPRNEKLAHMEVVELGYEKITWREVKDKVEYTDEY